MLVDHPWPGNVRQLKNAIERLVIMADHGFLDSNSLQPLYIQAGIPPTSERTPETLEALKAIKRDFIENKFGRIEKAFLIKALKDCQDNITQAANKVGMQRSNFSNLMKKHGVSITSRS